MGLNVGGTVRKVLRNGTISSFADDRIKGPGRSVFTSLFTNYLFTSEFICFININT